MRRVLSISRTNSSIIIAVWRPFACHITSSRDLPLLVAREMASSSRICAVCSSRLVRDMTPCGHRTFAFHQASLALKVSEVHRIVDCIDKRVVKILVYSKGLFRFVHDYRCHYPYWDLNLVLQVDECTLFRSR